MSHSKSLHRAQSQNIARKILRGKTIAVLGFGSQGQAQALNMRDCGLGVIVGLRRASRGWQKARKAGFEVFETGEAARRADIIHVLVPDEVHGEVYEKDIRPNLSAGKTLSFSHGFSITFGLIEPPKNVDVVLVSPKAPGKALREKFVAGSGVPGVFAVRQDYSRKAEKTALAVAAAIGLSKGGLSKCTFEQETHVNLFAEQAVLCGGLSELVRAGFETLVRKGYPPALVYAEVVLQAKLLADLINQGGVSYMWSEVSNTAEYGGRTRGRRVIGKASRKGMQKLLAEIQSGRFAKEWMAEHKSGLRGLEKMRSMDSKELIEKAGRQARNASRAAGGRK